MVEQIIRPTGLVDPQIDVRPVDGQIDDLLAEIKDRVNRNERALVTTLTKKMAEDLTDYLLERGIKVEYLHSDVDTLRRVELLRELREGKIDVIVGINLLREGLDLPEVSWLRSLTRTRKVSCVPIVPSSRRLVVPREMCPEPSSCMPMTLPMPCIKPLMKPIVAATSKSHITKSMASIRSR